MAMPINIHMKVACVDQEQRAMCSGYTLTEWVNDSGSSSLGATVVGALVRNHVNMGSGVGPPMTSVHQEQQRGYSNSLTTLQYQMTPPAGNSAVEYRHTHVATNDFTQTFGFMGASNTILYAFRPRILGSTVWCLMRLCQTCDITVAA